MIRESWSRAVLATSSVEEQAQELVARLQKMLPASPFSQEGAQKLVSEVLGKLKEHRLQVRSQVEEALSAGLRRLRFPSRGDLKALGRRVDELDAKISKIEADREKH